MLDLDTIVQHGVTLIIYTNKSFLELQDDFIIAESSFLDSGGNKVFQIMMVRLKMFVDEVLM